MDMDHAQFEQFVGSFKECIALLASN